MNTTVRRRDTPIRWRQTERYVMQLNRNNNDKLAELLVHKKNRIARDSSCNFVDKFASS